MLVPSTTGGLLLAGGRSTRFGAEKAVAPFRNHAMMDAPLAALAGFAHLAVSAPAGSAAAARGHELGLAVLADDPSLPLGPLNGVLAGLIWARARGLEFLATAPCDAPLLPAYLFARLGAEIGDAAAAHAVTVDGEHPLCALWRVDLATALRDTLAPGVHPPVWRFLGDHGARAVRFADAAQFANANTPETLAALERAP